MTHRLAFCLTDVVFLSPPPAGSRPPFATARSPLHLVQGQGQAVAHRPPGARRAGLTAWECGPRVLAVAGDPVTRGEWPRRPRGPGHLVPVARGPARGPSCLQRGNRAWEKQAFASRGRRWERTHTSSGGPVPRSGVAAPQDASREPTEGVPGAAAPPRSAPRARSPRGGAKGF